jgi:hypothetical protein
VNRPQAGRPKIRGAIPGRSKKDTFLNSVEIASEAHPVSYRMGTGGFFLNGKCGLRVKLSIHLNLMPRLRMCGAMFPVPPSNSWRVELGMETDFNVSSIHIKEEPG